MKRGRGFVALMAGLVSAALPFGRQRGGSRVRPEKTHAESKSKQTASPDYSHSAGSGPRRYRTPMETLRDMAKARMRDLDWRIEKGRQIGEQMAEYHRAEAKWYPGRSTSLRYDQVARRRKLVRKHRRMMA